ncbi:hypothetical protein CXB51_019195 [Gossypium anomalum]|uniref:Uncharacterized protein n=1 Tax=Gossypium anomalum TaxID=47600 RepID=A0A8J6CV74_9ROSI|nr:hypothetical protein CXB51_019195 [Gossypium anomalum]
MKILNKLSMENCKPTSTPVVVGAKLASQGDHEQVSESTYRSLGGCLLYLTASRPDIMFAISLLSRFMHCCNEKHFQVAKRVLKYIKGTLSYRLQFGKAESLKLVGYTDSDWVGSINDLKSTSGYAFTLGSAVFCWSSKKQNVMAQSIAEDEYVAAAGAVNQAIWLRKILADLNLHQREATEIYCDNLSTIAIAKNLVFHEIKWEFANANQGRVLKVGQHVAPGVAKKQASNPSYTEAAEPNAVVKYVWDLLNQAHMANAKLVPTPMLSSTTLTSLIRLPFSDGTLYRRVIGGLQYVYLTRPDIAFVANKCSSMSLMGFSNADWASSLEDHKSTTRFCIYLEISFLAKSTTAGLEQKVVEAVLGAAVQLTLSKVVLQDAEEKHVRDGSVRLWLQELRDVAYEIDDVLDEFTYQKLGMKAKFQDQISRKLCNLFTPSIPLPYRLNMTKKIKNINVSLSHINEQASQFGLQRRVGEMVVLPRGNLETHSLIGDSFHVVGRGYDVFNVINLLIKSSTQQPQIISVISIVGMAGLEKTTLAKLVCNSEPIQHHFGKIMWVCVFNDFDVDRILVEMLESLTKTPCAFRNKDTVLRRIQEELGEERYLLIFDDVWNENVEKWENLKGCLLGFSRNKRSKIIVTTRSDNVASVMGTHTENKHHPKKLVDDECWSIIKQKVFGSSSIPEEMEVIGKDIAKKCRGLPLVARLSFDHLPSPSLKRCFAYCSNFSRDVYIEQEQLIQLWMANGFLDPSKEGNMAMEDIGNMHFKALLSNSLFQDVERDAYGNIEVCKMHDLVHDLAVFPGNLKSLRTLKLTGVHIKKLPGSLGKLKHLRFFDISATNITKLPESFTQLYNLQTFRLLKCSLEHLPKGMRNLVSLRHIYFDLEKLMPVDIGRLTCLQTLPFFFVDMEKGCLVSELGSLSQLRGKLKIYYLEDVKDNAKASRANMEAKTKLYKLKLKWNYKRERPMNDKEVLERLKPCSNLKGLTIVNYWGDDLSSWLSSSVHGSNLPFPLNNLVKLKLINCRECLNLPCLGQLCNLTVLEIDEMKKVRRIGHEFYLNGQGEATTSFPTLRRFILVEMESLEEWVDDLESVIIEREGAAAFPCLEELIVSGCPKLKSDPIQRNLPSLQVLQVSYCSDISTLGDGLSASSRLKEVNIQACLNLRSIPTMEGLSTCLKELRICDCPNLRFMPSIQGFSSLTDLTIKDCERLSCLPSGIESCASLGNLNIHNCPSLSFVPQDVGKLRSLIFLSITSCQKLTCLPGEILGCLTSLETLHIGGFSEQLEEFEEWLGNFSSLQRLQIWNCNNLMQFPSLDTMKRQSKLQRPEINKCPHLKENCTKKSGLEWPKIAHIPNIRIQ